MNIEREEDSLFRIDDDLLNSFFNTGASSAESFFGKTESPFDHHILGPVGEAVPPHESAHPFFAAEPYATHAHAAQPKQDPGYYYSETARAHDMIQETEEHASSRTGPGKSRGVHQSSLKSEERTSEEEGGDEGAFMLEEEEEDEEEKDAFKKPKRRRRSKWTDNSQKRREKNRISARDSRKRKKEYIETLEMKLAVVEGERNRLLRVVETLQEREKIRAVSHMETLDQILTGRQQLYDRLEESVEKQATEKDIDFVIDKLQVRHGSFGTERKSIVSGLFKKVIENMMPNYVKYLLWASEHD